MLRYKQVIENKKYNGFIPYAYHFNNESIITKNGELIIVIKIISPQSEVSLKQKIQDFFSKNLIKDISFWITSIRSKNFVFFSNSNNNEKNIDSRLKSFSQDFHEKYNFFSKIENYENECYISLIIHDHINLLNVKNILQVISNFDKHFYKKNLEEIMNRLKDKCKKLMLELKEFKPRILSIKNENGELYSELELFFSKILCRSDKFIKLHKNDISSVITKNQRIKFLDSEILIKLTNSEKEIHCAVFSFKDIPSITNQKLIDNLMDLDCEIIMTEILISSDRDDKSYLEKEKNLKKFRDLIAIGEDESLDTYSKSIKNNSNIFLKQNILMIISDQENLDFLCYMVNKKFSENGIILYRENVAAEEVFWAQMPGNFHYSTRLNFSTLDKICNLNNVKTHENVFNNKLIFSDYFFSKKNFLIKEKNFFFIAGSEENIIFSIDFLIDISIGFDVEIIHFGRISEKKYLDYEFQSKMIYLNNISIKLQQEVKEIASQIFLIFEISFNESFNREAFNEIVEYFFQNKVEFNIQNFFIKINERRIFSELVLEKMKFLHDIIFQEKYNFIDLNEFNDEQIFLIFNMYLLTSAVNKICFGENILFYFKELKRFFTNGLYKDSLLKIITFIKKYDLYLYAEIFDHKMLFMDFMKDIESTLMFFPSNSIKDMYEILNISHEGLKFLNSIMSEDKIICFKNDNKFYFTDFDIQKFFLENKNFISSHENA